MNVGASVATADTLLFLHADTRLPAGFEEDVEQALTSDEGHAEPVAGAFRLSIDGASRSLRWIESAVNLRSRLLKMPYGDQALFPRAKTFAEVGGFPDIPLMEDHELVRKLRRRGRIVLVDQSVVTSARRWQRLGVWRTTLRNRLIVIAHRLGVSPERLASWYRK